MQNEAEWHILVKVLQIFPVSNNSNLIFITLPTTQFNLDIHDGAKLITNVTEFKRSISTSFQIFHSYLAFHSYY